MKTIKKMLSIAAISVLAFVCGPAMNGNEAQAWEGFDLQGAINAAGSTATTITLTDDAYKDGRFGVNYFYIFDNQDITIDLNGHTVYLSNGTYTTKGNFFNYGKLTIKNGKIVNGGTEGSPATYGGAICNWGGTLVVDNVQIEGCSAVYGGGAIANLNQSGKEATATIKGGTVIESCQAEHGGAIYNTGVMNIDSATISACASTLEASAIFNDGATDTQGKGNDTKCIMSNVSITDCSNTGHEPYCETIYNRNSTMEIKSGKVEGYIFCNDNGTPCKVTITGGMYSYKDLKSGAGSFVPNGYKVADNTDAATKDKFPYVVIKVGADTADSSDIALWVGLFAIAAVAAGAVALKKN